MSETRGPFDAVLYHLKGCLPDSNGDVDEYAKAIRVLEAAGKVDKKKLLAYLNREIDWKENDPYGPGSAEMDRELRTLIEVLPDVPDKEK